MLFIDAEIYAEYDGEAITGDEFARYAARACEAVDAATGWKLSQMWDSGELPGFVRKQVELACCAQAEYLYINGADAALDGVSGAGYMIGKTQVVVAANAQSESVNAGGLCRKAWSALAATGLLYTGVGVLC